MWNALPEVRDHWQQVIGKLIDATQAAIERERERGVAPPGVDAHRMAEGLIWQGERLLLLMVMQIPDALTVDEGVELGQLWMRAIYLADDPPPRWHGGRRDVAPSLCRTRDATRRDATRRDATRRVAGRVSLAHARRIVEPRVISSMPQRVANTKGTIDPWRRGRSS